MRDGVLPITHSGDFYTIDRVADALRARGATPLRLDSDLFPSALRLTADLTSEHGQHHVGADLEAFDLDRVRAVWTRRFWTPRLDEGLDPRHRESCLQESRAALQGFLDGVHGARWVNDPVRNYAAANKLLQLRLAREAGLSIPRTLVTNDPVRVKGFYDELGGAMVTKMLTPLSVSMGPADYFVHTSPVSAEDLNHLDGLQHCPMVFQERIEKAVELRIVHVDGQFFVGAIDASASATGQTDWRQATAGEVAWRHASLPGAEADGLLQVMRRLGLVYGAIDMIRTPDNRHVFLEVNHSGEWGMLERDLQLPISEAIADALLCDEGSLP